jgi:putative DNA methylase
MTEVFKKKLIEVALPLEAINRESAREKSIRHGHPSTLHLWWARRPLAACRAVLFAQLVDDPSSNVDQFPTLEDQEIERKRLFRLIERMVDWGNVTDTALFEEANREISKSFPNGLPKIYDPFAGGGSIPLEAQRLGLSAVATDLNPVAVLINKALIEIPPAWKGRPPVYPDTEINKLGSWPKATGLAEDVRKYGEHLKNLAQELLQEHYPKVVLENEELASPIAWIWARTVPCPNPACKVAVPLIRSFWLSKKEKRETWIRATVVDSELVYEVVKSSAGPETEGTVSRSGAICLGCKSSIPFKYIREHGKRIGLGHTLVAIVCESGRNRTYVAGNKSQERIALDIERPDDISETLLEGKARQNVSGYGLETFNDLFTNRQLLAMSTLSELVSKLPELVIKDSLTKGLEIDEAEEYAKHVSLYVAFAVSRSADYNNLICSWINTGETIRNLFARQAIPMTWDYAEANILGANTGNFLGQVNWVANVIDRLPAGVPGEAFQADASKVEISENTVVSTDPPYYDNISYADLSDFFYMWLRRSIGSLWPDLMGTMQTPKMQELVAAANRFDGDRNAAKVHFESGFMTTFQHIQKTHMDTVPITIYYAYKQTEDEGEDGISSTGWDTLLTGLIHSGLTITATWPIRTEMANRSVGMSSNALASSIILACRSRSLEAVTSNRRGFLDSLNKELPQALKELQQGSIAPVDMAQAAIGPGMAVFSSFARVLEADGSDMTVRTALALINQSLSEVLTQQEGDFDSDTRFCIRWFEQNQWSPGPFGDADTLARAVNTGVEAISRGGILQTGGGKASLKSPEMLNDEWDPEVDERISEWEVMIHLIRALEKHGADTAATLMKAASTRINVDSVKELTFQMYGICERKGWSRSGQMFNALGASWNEVVLASGKAPAPDSSAQATLSFEE